MQIERVLKFQEGKEIRVLEGDPIQDIVFCAQDVSRALDLDNTAMATATIPDSEKGIKTFDTLGGAQEMWALTLTGVLYMVGRSYKPEAERFRFWLYKDVVPSILATGKYELPGSGSPKLELPDPEWLKAAFEKAKTGKVQLAILTALGVTLPTQASAKTRGSGGLTYHARKISQEQAEEIMRLWNEGQGERQAELARKFNVSRVTIWKIVHGVTHKSPTQN